MELTILRDIVIVFSLALAVGYLCHRVRLPSIIGFLATGVIAGPHGLGLVEAVHEIEILSEVGVVMLLFLIGLEFSFKSLLRIKRAVFLGGATQVVLSILAGAGVVFLWGRPPREALFYGFLMALSSTAIVLNLLQEKATMDAPQGRTALAVLIFQDIIVVPMMLAVPFLAGAEAARAEAGYISLAKGVGVILILIAGAKWVVPRFLEMVVGTRSRELFMISIMFLCLSVAWLTNEAGLSLALGAFVAGLIVSESPYSHQAVGNVLPFKEVFSSFFFVSIGMLLDVRLILADPALILLAALFVLALKILTGGAGAAVLGLPLRVVVLSGFALSQVGEFSFILALHGQDFGLMAPKDYQVFLSTAVLTMALTPLMMGLGDRLTEKITPPGFTGEEPPEADGEGAPKRRDHVVIIGFGLTGRNVSRAATAAGIPRVIVEMNPETVRLEKAKGEDIIYGDAVNQAVLEHVGLKAARVLVVTIADPVVARRITALARALNPGLYIIARTRFLFEMKALRQIGADEVIPEEFETAVEIYARLLRRFLVPQNEVERL
ncbi:MAG: cation:proton antiporter, partial [Proteobacteria bacterium]|nr:cation:proton antiporter [Pseudomonadota bacterium]